MKTAYFERFTIDLPDQAVNDCSDSGECFPDVDFWCDRITIDATPNQIRAELKEYGSWNTTALQDDYANKLRIIWLAACNIKKEIQSENPSA